MIAAVRVELIKLTRSRVGLIATLALVVGTLCLLGGLTVGLASGNPQLRSQAKFSEIGAVLDWAGLFGFAAQITSAASLLGCGVVLAWMFGREFGEGTIVGLFALPISRGTIALAKLITYVLWISAVSVLIGAGLLAMGLVLGYGAPGIEDWASLLRQIALTMLSGALAVPVAFIATISRSLLAAIGGTIALVVAGQVAAIAGANGWMPLIAPALWAMSNGTEVSLEQLAFVLVTSGACAVLVYRSWSRLQLDR